MRRLLPLALTLLLLPAVLSGCIHLKQKIILNADLSGELQVTIGFPLELVVNAAAMAQAEENPEAPEPDPEAIKAEVIANIEAGKAPDGSEVEEVPADKLPEGLKMLGQGFTVVGENTEMTLRIGFDHIDKLIAAREVPLDDDKSLGELLGPIEVVQEGKAVRVSGQPLRMGEMTDQEMTKDEAEMAAAMFGDGSFSFALQSALPITDPGTGTLEGDTVSWTYDIAGLLDPAKRTIAIELNGKKGKKKKAKKKKAKKKKAKKGKKGKKGKAESAEEPAGSSDKTGI